jgi:hypothetical protein
MNQNQPTTMNTDTPTPETDSAYIQCPNEGAWDFRIRQEKTMAKLERERDEARADAEKAKAYKKVLKTTNANLKRERDEAVNNYETAQLLSVRVGEQRDRLIKSVEPLKYWRDISECDCSNPLPQGGCLRCDLNRILKTTNPNEL